MRLVWVGQTVGVAYISQYNCGMSNVGHYWFEDDVTITIGGWCKCASALQHTFGAIIPHYNSYFSMATDYITVVAPL